MYRSMQLNNLTKNHIVIPPSQFQLGLSRWIMNSMASGTSSSQQELGAIFEAKAKRLTYLQSPSYKSHARWCYPNSDRERKASGQVVTPKTPLHRPVREWPNGFSRWANPTKDWDSSKPNTLYSIFFQRER